MKNEELTGSGCEVDSGIDALQQEAEDLPMIVYLRGDEPYAKDFTIDADQAMEAIGIKRSRLTQISGRELRVGRARMGRYIKPFYRLEDINAYLAWIRPTASHKASADAVSAASDHLITTIEAGLNQLHLDMKAAGSEPGQHFLQFNTQIQRLTQRLEQSFSRLQRALAVFHQLDSQLITQGRRLEALSEQVLAWNQQMARLGEERSVQQQQSVLLAEALEQLQAWLHQEAAAHRQWLQQLDRSQQQLLQQTAETAAKPPKYAPRRWQGRLSIY